MYGNFADGLVNFRPLELVQQVADGATWTAVANTASFGFGSSTSDGIDAVAYGNGRFVAVGTQGKILYCDW